MSHSLKRAINLPGLIFYGVGTMIGGGIYALLGKVAGITGFLTPWAILIAGLMAFFSAMSFAELSARFPKSGGPAFYLKEAFNKPVGTVFGWLVISTGIVSAATLSVAVSGFLFDLLTLPMWIGQLSIVVLLCLVASWGITQSVTTVAIITLIEVVGLLLVISLNWQSVTTTTLPLDYFVPSSDLASWFAIFTASFLAFYAFIGFEDLVTLAEEVKGVKKNLPMGILISLLITMTLYIGVSLVAVVAVPSDTLAASHTPMAELVAGSSWLSPVTLVVISLLAGVNGALVQIIMAARVLYSMAQNNQAPGIFGYIHPKTQTPIAASILVAAIILSLALTTDLATLAKITSGIILLVFSGVNLALLVIKKRTGVFDGFQAHAAIPVLGLIFSIGIFLIGLFSATTASH